MLGPMSTVRPRKCPLEARNEGLLLALCSAQLLEKRCRQVQRHLWSLGVVAKLHSKIQELHPSLNLKALSGELVSLVLPGAETPLGCSFAGARDRWDCIPDLKNGNVFINRMSCMDSSCHPWIVSLNSLLHYHPQMYLKIVLSKVLFETGKYTSKLLSRLFGLYTSLGTHAHGS